MVAQHAATNRPYFSHKTTQYNTVAILLRSNVSDTDLRCVFDASTAMHRKDHISHDTKNMIIIYVACNMTPAVTLHSFLDVCCIMWW